MEGPASYQDVYDLLERTPAASTVWADGLVASRMSLSAIIVFLDTMSTDADSPLRKSEDEVLGEEIRKLNAACGAGSIDRATSPRFVINVHSLLTSSEQSRVVRAVSGFCQPSFKNSKRFQKNGHAVMNAVRRVLTGYLAARVPRGARVVEIGPDVSNWILSPSPSAWSDDAVENYSASRPLLCARDGVRMTWAKINAGLVEGRKYFHEPDVVRKAQIFTKLRESVFPRSPVPTAEVSGEYMLSFDSNYDIKFSDMPVAMALAGARAWYGTMVRAKGLTRSTRLSDGRLSLLGVNYRVDWPAGRIDFRHPECSAFGYSHDVFEYMKYEERNGYTWRTSECDYIYSKGAETTDEILFFSVVRVPQLHRMYEPRFVENPRAGMLKLTSVWGVGDEVNGLPKSFEAVEFHVDALNFSKVLEKRRALDYKGDISMSLALVRSTNVRFYMQGTPIGANERIAARFATATAIVVESVAHEQRLNANSLFDTAMYNFDMSLKSSNWFLRLLRSVVDYKVATNKVIAPIARAWASMREECFDVVLAPLRQIKVGFELVGAHVRLDGDDYESLQVSARPNVVKPCECGEIAELRAGIVCTEDIEKKKVLEQYLEIKVAANNCTLCALPDPLIGKFYESESSSSCDDDSRTVTTEGTDDTEVFEEVLETQDDVLIATIDECIDLENALADANLTECRVAYSDIVRSGPVNAITVRDCTTTRNRHAMLQFVSGKCIKTYGPEVPYGAMYSCSSDSIIPVRVKDAAMTANVPDGVYYTCNRMEIWNSPAIIAALEYARVYGKARVKRPDYKVTLGVPGAGKTYGMMQELARIWKSRKALSFLVVAVTNESAKAAVKYGEMFGMNLEELQNRVMTVDRYLMHKKFPADNVFVDEFPMVHMGKVEAVVSIASAVSVNLFGDARQIPYDPFLGHFKMSRATLGDTVKPGNIKFLPMTHRLARDVCAMWIDQYPSIYPCDCCNADVKSTSTLSYEKVLDLSHMHCDSSVRYHTYLRDDRDELRVQLGMRATKDELKAMKVGGLATVHEDQGSTHKHVVTVRLTADFDKNASKTNPSLFNRERYVLTDTTRHTNSYHYVTLSDEVDLIMKRIDCSKDLSRLEAVDKKIGYADVSVNSML